MREFARGEVRGVGVAALATQKWESSRSDEDKKQMKVEGNDRKRTKSRPAIQQSKQSSRGDDIVFPTGEEVQEVGNKHKSSSLS